MRSAPKAPASILLLGYGNPGRGDDALGPLLIERIEPMLPDLPFGDRVECLIDFQLQIEHTEDLRHRDLVLFVDAHLTASPPFIFQRIQSDPDPHFSTHALTPQSLMALHAAVHGCPPASYLLGIRGDAFELGARLSPRAEAHLRDALEFSRTLLASPSEAAWAREERQRIESSPTRP